MQVSYIQGLTLATVGTMQMLETVLTTNKTGLNQSIESLVLLELGDLIELKSIKRVLKLKKS